jgi:hypothetical protein
MNDENRYEKPPPYSPFADQNCEHFLVFHLNYIQLIIKT